MSQVERKPGKIEFSQSAKAAAEKATYWRLSVPVRDNKPEQPANKTQKK